MKTTATPCEVLVDTEARSGSENMRLDEELLQQVADGGTTSFARVYQWSEPTVSLGYFQKQDEPVALEIANCPRVRRLTGGGAILHHHELTYSCVVPATHAVRSNPVQLYERMHSAIICLLSDQGAGASMRQDVPGWPEDESAEEPFLCFLRSDARDVVIDGQKVLGSAQRRRRGTILQHGSILLKSSALTPQVLGISDLVPHFDIHKFAQELPAAVGRAISREPTIRTVSAST